MKHNIQRKMVLSLTTIALLLMSGCSQAASASYLSDQESEGEPAAATITSGGWSVRESLSASIITGTQVSPDGSEVAYVVRRPSFEGDEDTWDSEIWVAGANTAGLRLIGRGLGSADSPTWSPDGSTIAFLAVVDQGDLAGTRQIFLQPAGSGEAWRLSGLPGGVVAMEWSPSGERLALASPDAPSSESGSGDLPGPLVAEAGVGRIDLWVVEAKPGAEPRQVTEGDFVVYTFDWSPDGSSIAFAHSEAGLPAGWHLDVSVVDLTDGVVTKLAATSAAEMQPLFSPDGSTIAYICGENPTADFSAWRVELVPAPGTAVGTTRTLAVTPNESPNLVGWSKEGDVIFFDEAVGTTHALGVLPVSGEAPALLTAAMPVVDCVSLSMDGSTLGFAMQDFSHPVEAYRAPAVKVGSLAAEPVSRQNQAIAQLPVPQMELLHWQSSDGTEVEGMLTFPLDYVPGHVYPLVLSVHGGPAEKFTQAYFGQPDLYPYPEWASQGYAVLRINPRGSSGYGAAFRKANRADWGGGPMDDLMAGVDRVIAMGVADPERLAVVGWSYGGYMTANITTKTDRFKAAVVGAGPVDLVTQALTCDLPDMIPAYMGGYPWEEPEIYRSESPVFSTGKVETPTLILHGLEDTRVPYSQGQEWYGALRAAGVECEFVGYPRSGHVVLEPQLMTDLHQRALDWVGAHLSSGAGE